jgi:hypothetical protein
MYTVDTRTSQTSMNFTNAELLNLQSVLQVVADGTREDADIDYDGAQTTTVRYAVVKNQRRLQNALEDYQEVLNDLMEEHDVEPTEVGQIPQEASEDFQEDLNDLLQQDADFNPYKVSEEDIFKEPSIPTEILGSIEWMIGDQP